MVLRRLYDKGVVAIGIIAVLALMGCSDSVVEEPVSENLPEDLAVLQGVWESISTNGCTTKCGATIEGYTIRLRYQEAEGSPMVRHSSIIERIDEELQVFVLVGKGGAWPYFYGMEEGDEHLEVEFFNQQDKEWRRMHMKRAGRLKS